ncbi:MAG: TlpA disulfide reductase family protein [bacterium]
MKKVLLLLIGICCFISCEQQNNHFNINGTLIGQSDKNIMYLAMMLKENSKDGSQYTIVDSAKVENGTFHFEGTAEIPQLVYIGLTSGQFQPFYIENSDITYKAHVDSLDNAVITGSKTEDEFRRYNKGLEIYSDQRTLLVAEWEKAEKENDQGKLKILEQQFKDLSVKKSGYRDNYIASHKSSIVALYLADYWFLRFTKAEQIDSLLNTFDKSLQISPLYLRAVKWSKNLSSVSVGKQFLNFTANDIEGNPVVVSTLAKNKILLIDFWQAVCLPCRHEHPLLRQIYNEYHSKGFEILSVSLDKKRETWLEAVKKDGMNWNNVNDLIGWGSPIRTLYAASSTPQNYLIDRTGKIIARNIYGEDLRKFVEQLFSRELI